MYKKQKRDGVFIQNVVSRQLPHLPASEKQSQFGVHVVIILHIMYT